MSSMLITLISAKACPKRSQPQLQRQLCLLFCLLIYLAAACDATTHMSPGADIENLGSIELIKDSKERDVYF